MKRPRGIVILGRYYLEEEWIKETSSSPESAKATAATTTEEGIVKEHYITYRYRLCKAVIGVNGENIESGFFLKTDSGL
ncbi:MAG TPA: hypothetical protein VIK96_04255 [Bacilli bacterium]